MSFTIGFLLFDDLTQLDFTGPLQVLSRAPGAETALTLEESARRVQQMHDAAKSASNDVLLLCHGGPIAEPEDAQYILDHTEGIVGFYGASSMERLPVEPAIVDRAREFMGLKI